MSTITLSRYKDASNALRDANLAQALYDDGAVVMQDVLLTLHGDAHRARRTSEFRVFRRDFSQYYEAKVFPTTLTETLAPYEAAGKADLVEFNGRATVNLTADFAGIDRPQRTKDETEQLLRLVTTFGEGATLVHSKRNKEAVRAEVRAALEEFDGAFLAPSIARRKRLLAQLGNGEISEDDLPRDVLTVLLRNEDRLELPTDVLRREIAFYLQGGSHSTANTTTHAVHEVFRWRNEHPEDRLRIASDPLFLQRCIHESLRLHPASPVAWRRPVCSVSLGEGRSAETDDRVVIDLRQANRDSAIFGSDAEQFNPHRVLPPGVMPFGLSFGGGTHSCLGRDLDGGVMPRPNTDPTAHQYGIVTLLVRALLERGARPDPDDPPTPAQDTQRSYWGRYPVLLGRMASGS